MEFFLALIIVGIPTFFLVMAGCKVFLPKESQLDNAFVWLVTIVIAPVFCIGLIALRFTYYPQRSFDRDKWSCR